MGQFLAIGLATRISVRKSDVIKAGFNAEQLHETMTQQLHFVADIYHATEKEEVYTFVLKDEIMQAELIPFLQTFYPLVYETTEYYDRILQQLNTLPPSEWLEWAKGKPAEAFQHDAYGMSDYLSVDHSTIRVVYDCLLLSMEGKIIMEVYGRQFSFLKYTMMQAFKQFSIAGALRIYITG